MMSLLKAEFRKLLTVRSTYVLGGLALLIILVLSTYFEGYRGNTGSSAATLQPTAIAEILKNALTTSAIFVAIIAILFMAHEYRYNTIMYTLTAARGRMKVLFAKIAVITVFSVMFAALIGCVAIGGYLFGLMLRDASLPEQTLSFKNVWPLVYYVLANALVGLLFALLIRSVVGAVAVFFIVPGTIEALLGIVLKENTKYLPFTALEQVPASQWVTVQNAMTSGQAALLFAAYLTAGFVLGAYLFLRRDAV